MYACIQRPRRIPCRLFADSEAEPRNDRAYPRWPALYFLLPATSSAKLLTSKLLGPFLRFARGTHALFLRSLCFVAEFTATVIELPAFELGNS